MKQERVSIEQVEQIIAQRVDLRNLLNLLS
jgi:hypothetical protein